MISSKKEDPMKPWRHYTKWIDHYCKRAIMVVLICLLVIFITQFFMQFDIVRDVLVPTERWEGRRLLEP